MFRRTTTASAPAEPPAADPQPTEPVGKGRPTPKRRDAQKRRRGPVPTDRKEAAAQRRARMREQRAAQRSALRSGDERNLPARDAGPAKRLARDYVDARFTLGQIFFAMVLVLLLTSFARNPAIAVVTDLVMLVTFGGVLADSIRVGRRARDAVAERYGVKESTGITGYAALRAMQPRRMRRPPPRVQRGDTI